MTKKVSAPAAELANILLSWLRETAIKQGTPMKTIIQQVIEPPCNNEEVEPPDNQKEISTKRTLRPLKEILESSNYTDPKELAKALRVSTPTVYFWARENKIPHIKIGNLVRFDPADLKIWLSTHKINKTI